MNFTIDYSFIDTLHITESYSMYRDIPEDQLTNEQLVKIIKGEDIIKVSGSREHPEFSKLRDTLEEQGYIKCERSFWNGDTVLKSFTLNGWKFKKGDRFLSAGALRGSMEYAKKTGRKSLLL